MKKNIFLSLFHVILLVLFLQACNSSKSQVYNNKLDTESLEAQKLQLEVEQLELQKQFSIYDRILGITGGILGSFAVLWTIHQGYKTLKNQSDSQKSQKIADLLESMSNVDKNIRLGGARSISQYSNEAVNEILSSLRYERVESVRMALENTLNRVHDNCVKIIINENMDSLSERAFLLGRIHKTGTTSNNASTLLDLSPEAYKLLTSEFGYQFDYGKRVEEAEIKKYLELQLSLETKSSMLLDLSFQAVLAARGTANIIARMLREKRRVKGIEGKLDLSLTNLYRSDLSKQNFSKSLFSDCLMRHAQMDGSNFEASDLSGADIFGATINYANFSSACLSKTHLRSSVGENAIFRNAILLDATFSNANYRFPDFSGTKAENANFNSAYLNYAKFVSSTLNKAKFNEAELKRADFSQATCYAASFINANLTGANLNGAQFGGADLRGAIFTNTDLTNANLSGTNLSKADFRGANINGTILHKAKNFESAYFDFELSHEMFQ